MQIIFITYEQDWFFLGGGNFFEKQPTPQTNYNINPPMVWPFKIFQNLLTDKMAINISEPFKTLPHLSIPFKKILKV